jgi:phthalate 4,5-dioxygenase oxygenase subunit
MLSKKDNELLTQTGPGTPMGNVLRRYWVPALLDWELPNPDCEPVRVMIMSERLVAFRDSLGRVGILDENCPHRGASLWLGRNEECGLRCVYHGWKFDVDGNCLDQMNEEVLFIEKVATKAYPCVEIGGIIWTYMGPPELRPPLPLFAWTQVAAPQRGASKVIEECNGLQAFEGTMDTSHAGILHRSLKGPNQLGSPPSIEVDVTDYGYRYFSIRKAEDGAHFIKGYQFVMPWTQIRAGDDGSDGHYTVPIDDENCMMWNWVYRTGGPIPEHLSNGDQYGNGPAHVDQKTFKSIRNMRNDWLIDREMQRTERFLGVVGTNTQDRAVQETMGRVQDRTKEHLGPSDRQIIVARQLLQEAVNAVQEGEASVRGANDSYYDIRAYSGIVPAGVPLRDMFDAEMNPDEKLPVTAD